VMLRGGFEDGTVVASWDEVEGHKNR